MAEGLASFGSGFMRGFGTMSDHFNQKKRMEMEQQDRTWQRQRQADQDRRQKALHDKKIDAYEQETERNELRGGLRALERGRNVDPSDFESLREDDRLRQTFQEVTGSNPDKFFDPEKREQVEGAVSKVERVLGGEDKRNPREVMSDPEIVGAANTIFDDQVKKGIGEKTTHDGRNVTIEDKRISDIVPGPDGKSVMFEVAVEGTDEDGEKIQYHAPMTHMHSAQDESAMPVDVDTLGKRIIGHRKMLDATRDNPDVRNELEAALEEQIVRRGGEVETGSEWGKLNDSTLYDPETGEIKDVGGLPGAGGQYEVVRDDQGNPIAQRDPETGELKDLPDSYGGGGESGSDDLSIGSTEYNRITGNTRRGVEDTFRVRLGEQFGKSPGMAAVHGTTSETAQKVTHELVRNNRDVNPLQVGNTAADIALNDPDVRGLEPDQALSIAEQRLGEGAPEQEIESLSRQIQDEAARNLDRKLRESFEMGGGGGGQASQRPQGRGLPGAQKGEQAGAGQNGRSGEAMAQPQGGRGLPGASRQQGEQQRRPEAQQNEGAPSQWEPSNPDRTVMIAPDGNEISMGEIVETAKGRGMTPREVMQRLEQNGAEQAGE